MEIVEDEHERLGGRQPFEQLTDRPVAPVALVYGSGRTAAAEVGQRREQLRELDTDVFVEVRQSSRLDARQVLVQRIDEDPERQVAFEVGARSAEDDVPAAVGAGGELGEQPRLADAGCSDDLDRLGAAAGDLVERRVEFATAPGGVRRSGRRARTWISRASIRPRDTGRAPMSDGCPATSLRS